MALKLWEGGGLSPLRDMTLMAVVIVGLSLGPPVSSAFNLDPDLAQVFADPNPGTDPNRGSYFGFSVALQRPQDNNASWLVVGAPRANSSHVTETQIKEPGVLYKCKLGSATNCTELYIDQTGNSRSYEGEEYQHDLKDRGWLGASLDTQPTFAEGRQATAVCAPRLVDQRFGSFWEMKGVCYWLNSSLPDAPAHKKLPLVQKSERLFKTGNYRIPNYAYGEAGTSVHFPDDPTEMIIGAPGICNWHGAVIHYKDSQSVEQMFSKQRLHHQSCSENHIWDYGLMGYAVTSGKFTASRKMLYVSGAPKGANSLGKVTIFRLKSEERSITVVEWQGKQMGEYFGAALVAADINGDGLSDLIVGSPMYSFPDAPDAGRITAFLSKRRGYPTESPTKPSGSSTSFARFGTTLASLGNINYDDYKDIAVGAPWEGNGAVYIYLGSANGLRSSYSQRLLPEQIAHGLAGFGMGLSRGIDVDGNHYNDLAIGSFLSSHAVVVRSRPVATLIGSIKSTPSALAINDTRLQISACINYQGIKVPQTVSITGNITLDYEFQLPRATFVNNSNMLLNFDLSVTANEITCTPNYAVQVKKEKMNPRQPILLKMEYEISQLESSGNDIVLPVTDPGEPLNATSAVSIMTGCELDGNDICSVDMRVNATFVPTGTVTNYVIGSDEKIVLRVDVYNSGEPVFLPKLTLKVVPPLALFLPSSHECKFPKTDDRTKLVCRLANPITDENDSVDIHLDLSQLRDGSSVPIIDIEVTGEGVELHPADNVISQSLNLEAQANLAIHGLSEAEQILYQRLTVDEIKITTPLMFHHQYSVYKTGETPLEQVELIVDIPVNFIESPTINHSFVQIYPPSANFMGQAVLCKISGAKFALQDNSGNADDTDLTENADDANLIGNVDDADHQTIRNKRETENETVKIQADNELVNASAAAVEVPVFNCLHESISCAELRCPLNNWPSGSSVVDISFMLQVDLKVLATFMSAQVGVVVETEGRAAIHTLNLDLPFVGERKASTVVKTYLQPDSVPRQRIPWWIILLATLGGLLLLILLVLLLYKVGFFKRKKKEQLEAQKFLSESGASGQDCAAASVA